MTREPREERLARVALNHLFEPGEPRVCRAVADMGAVAVHRAVLHPQAGRSRSGEKDPAADAASRLAQVDPERELARAERRGIRFVTPGDAEWPPGLGDLHRVDPVSGRGEPPIGLWVRGPLRLDQLVGSVAVVGSRSATTYGLQLAHDVGADLGRAGLSVVSGGAIGIDQAAHRGALAGGGRTVAVMAGGVDRPYPSENRRLLDHLAHEHALVSEAPPGSVHQRLRFLSRNRLIAALTTGTVLVEAAIRSGALNTAHWAEQLSRPVMGVPGAVTTAQAQGVHQLIRAGGATLVTCGQEVLELVGESGEHLLAVPRGPARPRDTLSLRQRQILEAVPVHRPASTDSIARTAGIALLDVSDSLERLRKRDFVRLTDDGAGWVLGERARRH